MDKKLLLAMQYSCNFAGLAVPWNDIGIIMGTGITGGAVIQHLAKLRIRMVGQGLSVPPPLRRGGGGSRISTTTTSTPSKAKPTPVKKENGKTTPAAAKSGPAKQAKKAGKRRRAGSDESEDEEDSWDDDDSDGEYGKPPVKRVKTIAKGPMRRNFKMEEDSDGEGDEVVDTPKVPKRKSQGSKSSSHELSAYGTTDINGVPIDYDSEVEDDTNVVAAGAPFLALDEDNISHRKTGRKTSFTSKSLIVSLPATGLDTNTTAEKYVPNEEESGDDMADDDEQMNPGYSSPFFNQKFEDLPVPATQSEQFDSINQTNSYNPSYHASPEANGGSVDRYNGMFGGSLYQQQAANYSGGLDGGFFNLGQGATIHDGESGNLGNGFGHQNTNGYGDTSYMSRHSGGGLPQLDGQGHTQALPYPIQTSWPYSNNSSDTSVTQTPAGNSAGVDLSNGFFGQGSFDVGPFDGVGIDFSANEDSNDLFNAGDFDGNVVGGGGYEGGAYGSSYGGSYGGSYGH